MAEVILRDICKIFPGDVKAVSDFDLEVKDGEFVVLVGPSGCGKSTTLRMIAGLEEITAGKISIAGRVVNDVPPKNRDIAMVFQNYALYPHMTVYDNMAFGLKLRKFPRKEIDERIREAANILGLADLLDRKPKALSGGQRQRVAVGRAIVRKPAVFLFDEPLSNLDANLRVQMRVEISRLHNTLNATIVYVTHDQVEAMTMGDRIVVMKDGLVQQVADPVTLYDNPVNRFVAGFIGTPPMNFFAGSIDRADGSVVFTHGDGFSMPVPQELVESVSGYAGKAITMGIRPEDIGSAAAESLDGAPRIPAKVEVIEPMGSESYVYLNTGSETFVSRVDAHRRFAIGAEADLAVFSAKTHFFDPENEKCIC